MRITKIALYHIKPDQVAGYAKVSQLMDDFLKSLQGFISRTVKQDLNDETLFADIIEWESMEDSKNAEQEIHGAAELKPCGEALDKIVSFNVFKSL